MSTYSTPLQNLVDRMAYHCTAGQAPARMLDGFKWFDVPAPQASGADDFPRLQMLLPDLSESKAGRLIEGSIVQRIGVSTLRSGGVPGLVAAAESVMNAIETDGVTGRVDRALSGSLNQAIDISMGNGFADDISLNVILTLTMKPHYFERAGR